MEGTLFTNIEKTYYIKFQIKNEPLRETIDRVDNKLINDNFKWLCDRDILTSDVILTSEKSNNNERQWQSRKEFVD